MITVKSSEELAIMRKACIITGDVLKFLEDKIKPGVTTKELDRLAEKFIRDRNAYPSFKGYRGYPATLCVSIDDEVVHGIPSDKRRLEEGSIVSIDVGAYFNGFHGDAARTFPVGKVSSEKLKLIEVTKQSFFEGVKYAKAGNRIGDIASAIQNYCESFGYSVVRALTGHGIGKEMHEDPEVPNFGKAGHGVRLSANMTIAVEPMINMGRYDVDFLPDGWTVRTKDKLPSAHYENTIAITDGEAEILTL